MDEVETTLVAIEGEGIVQIPSDTPCRDPFGFVDTDPKPISKAKPYRTVLLTRDGRWAHAMVVNPESEKKMEMRLVEDQDSNLMQLPADTPIQFPPQEGKPGIHFLSEARDFTKVLAFVNNEWTNVVTVPQDNKFQVTLTISTRGEFRDKREVLALVLHNLREKNPKGWKDFLRSIDDSKIEEIPPDGK